MFNELNSIRRFWRKNWRELAVYYVYLIKTNFRYFRDNFDTSLYKTVQLLEAVPLLLDKVWTNRWTQQSKDYFIHFQPLWNFAGIATFIFNNECER